MNVDGIDKECFIGSADVVALYPSLDIDEVAEVVREMVKKELSFIKTDKFYREVKQVETFEKIAQTPKITKTNVSAQTPLETKKLFQGKVKSPFKSPDKSPSHHSTSTKRNNSTKKSKMPR